MSNDRLNEIKTRWAKVNEPDGQMVDVTAVDRADTESAVMWVAECEYGAIVPALKAAPADVAWLVGEVERLTRWKAWSCRRIERAMHNVEEGGEAERELKSAFAGPPKGWEP